MKKSILLFVLALAVLAGCVPQIRTVTLKESFNKAHAERLMRPGKNTIKVNAFLRQVGGGVVTCAGEKVYLTPATEMAQEIMTARYGNVNGGFVNSYAANMLKFANIDQDYTIARKESVCSSDGRVTFSNVASGEFYVSTQVTWKTVQGTIEGGHLSKLVFVENGETLDLVLSD